MSRSRILIALLLSSLAFTANAEGGVILNSSEITASATLTSPDKSESEKPPFLEQYCGDLDSLAALGSQVVSVASSAIIEHELMVIVTDSPLITSWQLENSMLPPSPLLDGLLKPS